jgi:hypothetical protein
LTVLAAAISFLAMPRSADAHHGFAAFDTKTEVTLKGTVTDFHFVNPHCVVEFDVKDDKGEVRKWQGELTSANRLVPLGWRPNSLKAGDEVTITGYPGKNGAPAVWINKLMSNGQVLKLGSRTD